MSHENRPVIEPLRIYSRDEVAEILDVSMSTVKRMIKAGQIRVSQPSGMRRIFIKGESILEFLDASEVDPNNPDTELDD